MPQPSLSDRLALREYPKDSLALMEQKWRKLLFLHWEYDAEEIQKTLPNGLFVDRFNGKAYIGLTPFYMKDIRVKMMPLLPGLSDVLEMNLRTYVYDKNGTPGIWFYSLDANSRLAVQMANTFYHLPYFYAEMNSQSDQDVISFRCEREKTGYSSEFLYKPKNESWKAEPDTLEFFLIERYALFSRKSKGHLSMGRVYHVPYTLAGAELIKWDDAAFEWDHLKRPNRAPDHVCFSFGVNVDIFALHDV